MIPITNLNETQIIKLVKNKQPTKQKKLHSVPFGHGGPGYSISNNMIIYIHVK